MVFCLDCSSKPLSAGAAERLQELGKLSSVVEQSERLSGAQWAVIENSLESADDVSMAVATLFLLRIDNERSRALLHKFGATDVQGGLLADAVLKTGHVTSELANAAPDKRVDRWREMATDPNPFSRIAAGKALCALDPLTAKAVLLRLEEEKSEISAVANRIRRELAAHMGEELPPPIPGFESLYIWFERTAGSLAMVQFGDVKSNRAAPVPQAPSSPTLPSPPSPTPMKVLESKSTPTTTIEEPASSSPWSIIVILIVAAIGLLSLLLKNRK